MLWLVLLKIKLARIAFAKRRACRCALGRVNMEVDIMGILESRSPLALPVEN